MDLGVHGAGCQRELLAQSRDGIGVAARVTHADLVRGAHEAAAEPHNIRDAQFVDPTARGIQQAGSFVIEVLGRKHGSDVDGGVAVPAHEQARGRRSEQVPALDLHLGQMAAHAAQQGTRVDAA